MEPTHTSLEEKAIRLFAAIAVFWSFYAAATLGMNAFQNMIAYANEPYMRAMAIDQQTAALLQSHQLAQVRQGLNRSETPPLSSSTPPYERRENAGTSTPHCPRPSMALTRGGQNKPDEVMELQRFLAERYQQKMDDMVTGHFGPLTERLMMKFQEEQGLPAVGIVGPLTRAAIARVCEGSTTATAQETSVARPDQGGKTKPALVITDPIQNESVTIKDQLPVSWTATNAPQNSRVRITLSLVNTLVPGSEGVTAASFIQPIAAGVPNGTYTIDLFLNNYAPGTYKVAAHIEACPRQGCYYNGSQTKIYTTASPVSILLTDVSEAALLEEISVTEVLKDNNDTTTTDDEGVFTIEFSATPADTDMWINKTASRGDGLMSGVNFIIRDGIGNIVTTGTTSASLTSTASTDGTRSKLFEAETEDFTLAVEFDPETPGTYRLEMSRLNYATTNANPTASVPAGFKTDALSI